VVAAVLSTGDIGWTDLRIGWRRRMTTGMGASAWKEAVMCEITIREVLLIPSRFGNSFFPFITFRFLLGRSSPRVRTGEGTSQRLNLGAERHLWV